MATSRVLCCCLVIKLCLTQIPWTVAGQAPLSSTIPGVCSISCPLSWWYYRTISSSATPFSFVLQSFPASGSFPMSQLFTSGGQSGASASAAVLPMNIQGWFPLGVTDLIYLQSKSLLQHHNSKALILWCSAFFVVQLSHTYMTTENNHGFDYTDVCQQSDVSAF